MLFYNHNRHNFSSSLAVIDLSDEQGEIKHLQEHKIEYANSYLKERETLILLEIESKYGSKPNTSFNWGHLSYSSSIDFAQSQIHNVRYSVKNKETWQKEETLGLWRTT